MGNRFIFLLILAMFFVMPMIVAQPVFKQNEANVLKIPCTIDGVYCSGSATCSATILDPVGNDLYNNEALLQNSVVFELNLTTSDNSLNGEYQLTVSCTDGNVSNSKTLVYFVTPNGKLPTTAKGILYGVLLIIFVVFFVITLYKGLEEDGIVMKSVFLFISYLMLMGITFIGWNLSADYLTSAPFLTAFFRILWLFFMYALFPIILVLTFYTMWMMKEIKEIKGLMDRGIPMDEAVGRKGGKKW